MTSRRRQLCKSLARGSHFALAQKCLRDHRVKKYITKGFGTLLRKEIAALCSSDGSLTSLKWDDVLQLMKVKAPTLLPLLQRCNKNPQTEPEGHCQYTSVNPMQASSTLFFHSPKDCVSYFIHWSCIKEGKLRYHSIQNVVMLVQLHLITFLGLSTTSENWSVPLPYTDTSDHIPIR